MELYCYLQHTCTRWNIIFCNTISVINKIYLQPKAKQVVFTTSRFTARTIHSPRPTGVFSIVFMSPTRLIVIKYSIPIIGFKVLPANPQMFGDCSWKVSQILEEACGHKTSIWKGIYDNLSGVVKLVKKTILVTPRGMWGSCINAVITSIFIRNFPASLVMTFQWFY